MPEKVCQKNRAEHFILSSLHVKKLDIKYKLAELIGDKLAVPCGRLE
jgi:hypothetical protein